MPKTLSLDLRERIVRHVREGHSRRSAAAKFTVSASSAVRIVARYLSTGSVAPKAGGVGRRSRPDTQRDYLVRRIAEVPDITMPDLAAELAARGIRIDPSNLSRWFIRNGYRFKKTLLASEQDRPDIREARQDWVEKRQPKMRMQAHRLVFVDETGTTTKMTRLYGRCYKADV